MLRRLCLAVYRGFFWTYERGSWQYDVMVILILAFIFLTPRNWFHDRPPFDSSASDVVLLFDDQTVKIYQLTATLVSRSDPNVEQGIRRILQDFTGTSPEITRIEPARNSRGQVVSYAVWVRQ